MDKETFDKRMAEAKEEQRRNREYIASCWREDGVPEEVVQKYLLTGKLPMVKGVVQIPKKYQESKTVAKTKFVEEGLVGL